MVEAASNFRKNGFGDEESAQLAQIAAYLQNVADEQIDAGTATDFLISQIKGFGIAAEDAIHIVDAVNQVSNEFSLSSGDLTKNLGTVSAALSVGGNKFEEVLGLMTSGTEIMRSSNKVARSLISVQSRLNQIVDEESSTGKKLTAWYNEHNIAIYNQEGQIRSLYEILTDVNKIWGELDKNEQAYYLNIQAGANQTASLAAILSNYATALEATDVALNSQGSALKENASYMESLAAAQSQLQSAWEAFSNSVVDSDLVRFFIGAGTGVLKVLNTDLGVLISQFGLLTGVGTGALNLFGQFGVNITKTIPGLKSLEGLFSGMITSAPLVSAGIAAITLGVALGYSEWKKYHEEVYGTAEDLQDAIDASNKSFKETEKSVSATASVAQVYVEKLEALDKQSNKTNEEIDEMSRLVDLLNGLFPDLGLTIDGTTGKLNKQTKAITDQIDAWKKLAIQQAYAQRYQEQLSAYADASIELDAKKTALAENQAKQVTAKEKFDTAQKLADEAKASLDKSFLKDPELRTEAYNLAIGRNKAYQEWQALVQEESTLNASISVTQEALNKANTELEKLQKQQADFEKEFEKENEKVSNLPTGSRGSAYDRAKSKVGSLLPAEGDEYKGRFDYDAYLARQKHYLNIGLINEQEYYAGLEGMLKVFTDESLISTEKRWKAEEDIFKYKQNLAKEQQQAYEDAVRDAERAAQQEAQAQRQAIADVKSEFTAWQDEQDYLLSTGQITETEYYDRLKQKNDELFKGKKDFLSQYWTNLEKIYKWESGQIEDQFDEWQKQYQHKLNMGEITEEQYYTKLKEMNEQYFANQEKYLDKYWKNEEDYYKWKKQQIEDIHEATQKALEDEIAKEKEKLELKKNEAEKRKQQLEDQQDEIERLSDYVQAMADSEIDKIDEKITALKDEADAITEKYKDQIDALEQQNQAIDDQISKQKLLEALAKAQQTKKFVFKDGRFQYVSDYDAINEAQSQLDEFNREQALQEKTKQLEKQRDLELEQNKIQQKALEEEKKRWQEYKTGWANITKAYTDEQNALLAQQKLGIDVEKATWDERLSNLESFKDQYISLARQIKAAEAEIAGYDTAISNVDSSANQDAKIREMMKANSEAWHKTTDASERERLHEANEYLNSLLSNQGTYNSASGQWSNLSYQSASAGNSAASVFTGSPITSGALASSVLTGGLKNAKQALSQIFNLSNVNLPNVSNAKEFVAELKNMALQAAYSRG